MGKKKAKKKAKKKTKKSTKKKAIKRVRRFQKPVALWVWRDEYSTPYSDYRISSREPDFDQDFMDETGRKSWDGNGDDEELCVAQFERLTNLRLLPGQIENVTLEFKRIL